MRLFPEERQQEQTVEEGTAVRLGSTAEEKKGERLGRCMGFHGPGEAQFPPYTGLNNGPLFLATYGLIHENHCCSTPLYRL